MSKQKKKVRFKTKVAYSSSKPGVIDIKSDDLAMYARQAESQVIPIIRELEIEAGAAVLLLAQYTQALISGNSHITLESATTITDSILAIWQAGTYHPSPEYPFTLEETLQDFKGDLKAKADYSKQILPFTPSHENVPLGAGRLAAGIALHPKNLLWHVWIIAGGPCALLGAYHDPAEAQRSLERIINIARYGDASTAKYEDASIAGYNLYRELISQGDGQPMEFSYDMMTYILENIHLYAVEL